MRLSLKAGLTSALGVSILFMQGAYAKLQEPVPYPEPRPLDQRAEISFISPDELQTFEKLAQYSEPGYITELVKAGKLPPVEERLPKQPLVFKASGMSDGLGEYGGVLRMGAGQPAGWNWVAGQHQGWGGVNYAVQETLTRTAPLFQFNADEVAPQPNLAQSWEWSEDGYSLTMHLIRGAKWSDGDDFNADDILFMWEDNILDPNVPSLGSPDMLGEGTSLEKVDEYTIRWSFKEAFPTQSLYAMSSFGFSPGPSHLLKQEHPRHNPDKTYSDYRTAFSPDRLPWVTMGAWTVVEHKPNEISIMRRNPYYWKVDESGKQLPYIEEVQYKLAQNTDRTVQALAGNADYSNMENPPIYTESLRQINRKDSPVNASFGPRTLGWQLHMNMAETYGAKTDREKAIRQLNRDFRFRRAISHAVDREALGQSLVRGPFTHVYAGGLFPGTGYFDKESVTYYPYSPESTRQLLAELGLEDTNGDGIVEWTEGPTAGEPLEITMLYPSGGVTEEVLAENLITMFHEVGIRIIPMGSTNRDAVRDSGEYDFHIWRGVQPYITPDQSYFELAATSPLSPYWHKGSENEPQNLQPFEKELLQIVRTFQASQDPAKKVELMRQYNEVFTENIYHVGLTVAPGALVINKRLKNVPDGTPILAYQWAEDAIMRERMWVPEEQQLKETFPGRVPGVQ